MAVPARRTVHLFHIGFVAGHFLPIRGTVSIKGACVLAFSSAAATTG
jgi:hypothetical protein